MKVVSYRMPDELIELIRHQSQTSNKTASDLVREAIVNAYQVPQPQKKIATPA